MKKIYVFAAMAVLALGLTYCSSSKKAAKAAVPKATYAATLTPIIAEKCAPCHIPSKGGNKKAYDNYANVKTDIDEIIRRIELNPTDKGFMPFKKTEKLPAELIAAFKKFKEDGLLEN
jgi:mono/diheme cytochrome c family protein